MSSINAVQAVIDALESLKIPYMIVGALATNLYGLPRNTKDADFVIDLGATSAQAIAQKLGPDFNPDPQMSFETVTGTQRYIVEYRPTQFVIELFLLRGDDPYHQMRFSRRRRAVVEERQTWVPLPEDVIVMKMRWGATKRRAKDIDDVVNVLRVQQAQGTQLDWNYIHHWCDIHGTRNLLDEVRRSIPSR